MNVDLMWRERDLLAENAELHPSPFLVQLHWAFQTRTEVMLVMDFMQGMSYLSLSCYVV